MLLCITFLYNLHFTCFISQVQTSFYIWLFSLPSALMAEQLSIFVTSFYSAIAHIPSNNLLCHAHNVLERGFVVVIVYILADSSSISERRSVVRDIQEKVKDFLKNPAAKQELREIVEQTLGDELHHLGITSVSAD